MHDEKSMSEATTCTGRRSARVVGQTRDGGLHVSMRYTEWVRIYSACGDETSVWTGA